MKVLIVFQGIRRSDNVSFLPGTYEPTKFHSFVLQVPVNIGSTLSDVYEEAIKMIRVYQLSWLPKRISTLLLSEVENFFASQLEEIKRGKPDSVMLNLYGEDAFLCSDPVASYAIHTLVKIDNVRFVDTVPTISGD